jgi:L-fuculose-phosphate aldolase
VLVHGHGTFTAGRTLDEAYILTSLAEHSCRVLWLAGELTLHRSG